VGPDAVVAGTSAAAVWGIPIVGDWPSEVSLLETPRSGGKSEPGVRRTSAGAANATIGEFDGMRVTSLARTALDLARRLDLPDAVATLDWTRWRRNDRRITADDLRHEWQAAHFRTGSAHLERAIAWSTDLSDSFGESRGRVAIRLLGFPEPELQRRFVDAEGAMEADYYFDDADIAGEFDGKIKYTRRDLTNGDPSAVVWREKLRQDRLRRLVSGVFRIVDADLTNPTRLARILLDAGVRRR
jgi:hypothetical protein